MYTRQVTGDAGILLTAFVTAPTFPEYLRSRGTSMRDLTLRMVGLATAMDVPANILNRDDVLTAFGEVLCDWSARRDDKLIALPSMTDLYKEFMKNRQWKVLVSHMDGSGCSVRHMFADTPEGALQSWREIEDRSDQLRFFSLEKNRA